MTTVVLIGSSVIFILHSPSVGCVESNTPESGECVVNLMRSSPDPVNNITDLLEDGHRVKSRTRRWCVGRRE